MQVTLKIERYNPESYSSFFSDHRTMRSPVPGTISRDWEESPEVATGLVPDQSAYVMSIPSAVVMRFYTMVRDPKDSRADVERRGTEKMLSRGRERFGIYCAPCHGQTGDGKGMVVHAPQTGDVVKIVPLSTMQNVYQGAVRLP